MFARLDRGVHRLCHALLTRSGQAIREILHGGRKQSVNRRWRRVGHSSGLHSHIRTRLAAATLHGIVGAVPPARSALVPPARRLVALAGAVLCGITMTFLPGSPASAATSDLSVDVSKEKLKLLAGAGAARLSVTVANQGPDSAKS